MSKIIQFEPSRAQQLQNRTNNSQQKKYTPIQEQKMDTFELKGFDPDFFEKLEQKEIKHIATSAMLNEAEKTLFEAMKSKQEVTKLINKLYNPNCPDRYGTKENPIFLEEDCMGRFVMSECDRKENDKRVTTFFEATGEIQSILTHTSKKTQTKVVFFNHSDNYMEVRKQTSPNLFGKYTEEIFTYRNNKPEAYITYQKSIFSDSEEKEHYIFQK